MMHITPGKHHTIPKKTVSKTQAQKDRVVKRDTKHLNRYKSALKIKSLLKSKSKTNASSKKNNNKISNCSTTTTEDKKGHFNL
jgi:hypothetical protein